MTEAPAIVRAACELRAECDAAIGWAGELLRTYSARVPGEVIERSLCETLANATAALAAMRENLEHALVRDVCRYEDVAARHTARKKE